MTRDLQPFVYRYFAHLNLIPCWFHRVLADALIQFVDDVEHRRSPRLIIEAPPRHSKSLFTTRGLVPWILAKHPNWDLIVANSTQRLADYFGRDIQRVTGDPEYQAAFPQSIPSKESNAVNYAMNNSRGQYMLIGAGGKLPGFGGKCIGGDSNVSTPSGTKFMRDLQIGDTVDTPIGPRRVSATYSNGLKECVAIGVGGRSLVLTADHRVYTETGWQEAGSLHPGDGIYVADMQTLRKALHPEGSVPREVARACSVLLASVLECIKEGAQAVQAVWKAIREIYRESRTYGILFAYLLYGRGKRDRDVAVLTGNLLPGMREGVSTPVISHKVLFEAMQEQGALQAHGELRQPELPDWEMGEHPPYELYPQGISGDASGDWEMPGVRGRWEATHAPYQRTEERRPPGELSSAVCVLSPEEAHCKLSYIESVRNVGAHQVYDATVEDAHCFFADGVLVHNCLIADDIVSGREMAESETQMEALWDWFNGDFMNRVAPGGGVIIMATRWALKDITGRVLAADAKGKWKRLSFPALAEQDEPHRRAGEPLQPEWYTKEMLEEERDRLIASGKERDWISLFQQRPANASGNFFKSQHFVWRDVERIPKPDAENTHWYLGVDFAASTKATADCRALVPIGVNNDGFYYFGPDPLNGRYSPNEFVKMIIDKVEKYRPLKLFCEKGPLDAVYGPLLRDEMARRKVYVAIEPVKSGEKWVVAAPMQARMEASKVIFPDNQFYRLQLAPQFLNFTPGADGEDDMVDASAKVFSALDKLRAPAPKPVDAKPDPIKEDRDHWAKIDQYARGATTNPFSPQRLNGGKY